MECQKNGDADFLKILCANFFAMQMYQKYSKKCQYKQNNRTFLHATLVQIRYHDSDANANVQKTSQSLQFQVPWQMLAHPYLGP